MEFATCFVIHMGVMSFVLCILFQCTKEGIPMLYHTLGEKRSHEIHKETFKSSIIVQGAPDAWDCK